MYGFAHVSPKRKFLQKCEHGPWEFGMPHAVGQERQGSLAMRKRENA